MAASKTPATPEDVRFDGDPEANAMGERLMRELFDGRGRLTPVRRDLYSPETLGSTEGMPTLRAKWLDLYPDFPYHVKGRRYEGDEDPECYEAEVYLDQRDVGLVRDIVDRANDQLRIAIKYAWDVGREDMPAWRQPSPTVYRRYSDIVVSPEKFCRLTLTPVDVGDDGGMVPTALPFEVTAVSPIFPPSEDDYEWQDATTTAMLDDHGEPVRIESALRIDVTEGDYLASGWWEVASVLVDGTWIVESIAYGMGPDREFIYRRGSQDVANASEPRNEDRPAPARKRADSDDAGSIIDHMPIAQWLMGLWNQSGKPGCPGCLLWLMAICVYLVLSPVDLVIGLLRWKKTS